MPQENTVSCWTCYNGLHNRQEECQVCFNHNLYDPLSQEEIMSEMLTNKSLRQERDRQLIEQSEYLESGKIKRALV